MTVIDLRAIAPKVHGKYSPNLHRWLKHNRWFQHHSDKWCRDIDVFDSGDRVLFIGSRDHDGALLGSRLYTVLVSGSRAVVGCWVKSYDWPIVDDFWSRYIAVGRCAIDPEHKVSFREEHGPRYAEDGDSRVCNWCGVRMRRERWTETRTYPRERWVVLP